MVSQWLRSVLVGVLVVGGIAGERIKGKSGVDVSPGDSHVPWICCLTVRMCI